MATEDMSRSVSPSPELSPTPAIGACPELSRCVSMASSGASDHTLRHLSSGSEHGGAGARISRVSRQSSFGHDIRHRRRGYMRPHTTSFAASAKSRESVMSLGSIAHLQYYFARTGLLDGKGGQLARKRQKHPATLDLSALESNPQIGGTDADSSYASMGSSPDLNASAADMSFGMDESLQYDVDDHYDGSFGDSDPEGDGVLPPTVSTYHYREKVVPKPPTVEELKADLRTSLADAKKVLREVSERKAGTFQPAPDAPVYPNMPDENTQPWYELQGMQVLDVVTLAIRAAKLYYTAYELPDRLDAIKSEKEIRADLLAVMEMLKQMATRNFKDGMRTEEITTMDKWIDSVLDILKQEQDIEAAEKAERASWVWMAGEDWTGRELERERAFLASMNPDLEPIPEWTAASDAAELPTPFLQAMQNGVTLIKLHNAIVKKSRRRYGAIPTFHTDTQKPYRCAENLRYWLKAAELRFEINISMDVMGVVCNNGPEAWQSFERAILQWCRHVREEITKELHR